MNAALATSRLLAALRATKTDKTKFLCLRKVHTLLRDAASREISAKMCLEDIDVFQHLLVPSCGRGGTGALSSIDLNCACVTILCLRELCRSSQEGISEGLRMWIYERHFLDYVESLVLRSTFKPLHSAAIMFFVEMSQDVVVSQSFLPDVIMTLLSTESFEAKRTAMSVLICVLKDHIPLQAVRLCPLEYPWLWETLPQLCRVMLSIHSPPAARFDAAEGIVLISVYSCLEENLRPANNSHMERSQTFTSESVMVGEIIKTLLMIPANSEHHPFLSSNQWGIQDEHGNTGKGNVTLLEQKESIKWACYLIERIIEEEIPFRRDGLPHNSLDGARIGMEFANAKLLCFHRENLLENLVAVSCFLEVDIMQRDGDDESCRETRASLDLLYAAIENWITVDGECSWRLSMLLSVSKPPTYSESDELMSLLKALDAPSRHTIVDRSEFVGANQSAKQRSYVRKSLMDFKGTLEKARIHETRLEEDSLSLVEGDGFSYMGANKTDTALNESTPPGEGYKTLLHLFGTHGYPHYSGRHRNYRRRRTINHHHRRHVVDTAHDSADSVDMKPASDAEINQALAAIGRMQHPMHDPIGRYSEFKQRRLTTRKGLPGGGGSHGGEGARPDEKSRSISGLQSVYEPTVRSMSSPVRGLYTTGRPVLMSDLERPHLHEDQLFNHLGLASDVHNRTEKERGEGPVAPYTSNTMPLEPRLPPPSRSSPAVFSPRRRISQRSKQFSPLQATNTLSERTAVTLRSLASSNEIFC